MSDFSSCAGYCVALFPAEIAGGKLLLIWRAGGGNPPQRGLLAGGGVASFSNGGECAPGPSSQRQRFFGSADLRTLAAAVHHFPARLAAPRFWSGWRAAGGD